MDGCINGELCDDDRKAATNVAGILGGSVKMLGLGGLDSWARFSGTKFLEKVTNL
jgi:hypothetical protein